MSNNKKINIQLLFDAQEFACLQNAASQQGLPVPMYIKYMVLPGNHFFGYWQQLLQLVAALPAGTKFNIKSLFGTSWTMDTGVKLNLGKTFNNQIKAQAIAGVKQLAKDSSKVMWYEKL